MESTNEERHHDKSVHRCFRFDGSLPKRTFNRFGLLACFCLLNLVVSSEWTLSWKIVKMQLQKQGN